MADAGNPYQWMDYSSLSPDQQGQIIPQAQRYISQQTGAGQNAPQVYMLPGGQYTTQIPTSILNSQEYGQISNQPNQDSSNVKDGYVWALPGGGFTPKEPSAQGYAPAKSSGGGKGFFDYLAPIAETALAFAGFPEVSAGIAGLKSGVETGSPLAGLTSAAGSYFGGELGSSLGGQLGNQAGGFLSETPGNALGDIFGGSTVGSVAPFGSFAGNALGSSTIGSIAGGAIGSSAGNSLGSQFGQQAGGGANTQDSFSPQASMNATPSFQPGTTSPAGLPQSLSQFSGLDPFQQATNIASKGVYGSGNGRDENSYFLNLVNRQLQDPTQGFKSVNPVENSYLSQLGLGGYSNQNDLMQGISKYAA